MWAGSNVPLDMGAAYMLLYLSKMELNEMERVQRDVYCCCAWLDITNWKK